MKAFFLSLLLTVCTLYSNAQTGAVRVKVVEGEGNSPVPFAMVQCLTAATGGYTSMLGVAVIVIEAGVHDFQVTHVGRSMTIQNVRVSAGDTLDVQCKLESQSELVGTITIRLQKSKSTDQAVLMERRKAVMMSDGVSSESISRSGASTAGQAVAMAPGVSLQDGKHVIVRGLGDRYSKTIVNSMTVPGLDPDRNSMQLDIFPSSLLENVVVYKTFSPNLPGDFSGGLVNLNTKIIPSSKIQSVSFSVGINPAMHFNRSYLTYEGGSLDFLGFDDGTRALPISPSMDLNTIEYSPVGNDMALTELTSKFNKTLAPTQAMNGPDLGFSYTLGNRFVKDRGTFGVFVIANYKKSSTFYDQFKTGTYIMSANSEEYNLLPNTVTKGQVGESDVKWSLMFGSGLLTNNGEYRLNVLHSQNGQSKAAILTQEDLRENPSVIIKNNLEYSQRSLTNIFLSGKHKINDEDLVIDWRVSPTRSVIYEPDIRLTAFELTDDENPRYEINEGVGAVATRTYRYLDENTISSNFDVKKKLHRGSKDLGQLKFGAQASVKVRNYSIVNYQFRVMQESKFEFSGDANELLDPANIWTPSSNESGDSGVYVSGNFEPSNTFEAQQNILASYIMHEYSLNNKLKLVYGLRMEKSINFYTGVNQNLTKSYNHEKLLDELNLLPSTTMIYSILEDRMNLRLAYNKTLARPSFKELSNAQIVDRISGTTFIGNENLQLTTINNFDVRWENFSTGGQVMSVTGFYKQFHNPIELVAYSAAAPDNFQPRNVGMATVIGVEIESIRNIEGLTDSVKSVQVGGNVTVLSSSVQMTDAEYQGRLLAAREGALISDQRPMEGQSPYLINAFLNYKNKRHNWYTSLNYNVQGPRLAIVGVSRIPDVFELPFHSLNIKGGIEMKSGLKLSLNVSNILNSSRKMVYSSYNASEEIYSLYQIGRTIGLNLSLAL